ncbi:MAG: hypothetical protein JW910_00340 [Anaerolineae bacterium]|nr:hypothetical protein [Anaerolineae bacterium]
MKKRFPLLLIGLAAVLAVVLVPGVTNAQGGLTASGVDTAAGHYILSPNAPPGSILLYDQTSSPTGVVWLSQNFEPALDTYDSWLADDFVVTATYGWNVDSLFIDGSYYNTPAGGTPGPADSVNVVFHANDGGGVPGSVLCNYQAIAMIDDGLGNFTIDLPTACPLPGGTYWLDVQANMDYTPHGQWGWQGSSVVVNVGAQFEQPGDGLGTGCVAWSPLASCFAGGGPDLVFQVWGRVVPTPFTAGYYEETDANFDYNANWKFKSKVNASGGAAAKAKVGAIVYFAFDGNVLVVVRKIGPLEGAMQVCIDGMCQVVSNTAAVGEWQVPVAFGPYPAGVHSVSISRPAGEARFWFDAIQVIDLSTVLAPGVLYQEDDPGFVYVNDWVFKSKAAALGGGVAKAKDAESAVFFAVSGDEFTLYRRIGPGYGDMTVCIDGVCNIVSNEYSLKLWAQPVTFSGMGAGTHVVGVYRGSGKLFFDAVWVGTSPPMPGQVQAPAVAPAVAADAAPAAASDPSQPVATGPSATRN